MTPKAIITMLMALGMTWEEADSSLDRYCTWHGSLPTKFNHIRCIWKANNMNKMYDECNDQCYGCNRYAARKNNPTGRIDNQPGECQICFLNPSFIDNFEQEN